LTPYELIGGEATVKRYFRENDGRVRLQPANPAMEPIYVDEIACGFAASSSA
jgi:repressor LexA